MDVSIGLAKNLFRFCHMMYIFGQPNILHYIYLYSYTGIYMSIHIHAYLVLLHFIILCRFCDFFQIEDLWQPCIEQAFWHHFFFCICIFIAVFAYFISLSCVNNSYNISNFCYCRMLWWSVISELWWYYYDSIKAQRFVNIF